MTRKQFLSKLIITLVGLFAVIIIGTSNGSKNRGYLTHGYNEPYSIVFNENKNKIGTEKYVNPITSFSGEGTALTGLNNPITFDYVNFTNQGGMWQNIRAGGSLTNTMPISGMTKLSIVKKNTNAHLKVYWSNSQTFDESRSVEFDTSSALNVETYFDNYKPNYIKLTTLTQSQIDSMLIEFDCSDYYPSVDAYSSNSMMGSVNGSGIYVVGSDVTLTATPNNGYQFIGWFQNNILVSNNPSYNFTMSFEDVTIEGRFAVIAYNLVVTSENPNKGTVIGTGTYDYLEEVEITATPNEGYTFVGWYENNVLVSYVANLTFNMPHRALNYVAKFEAKPYEVTLENSNQEAGTVTGAKVYDYTQNVALTAEVNDGYSFVGWFEDDELISSANPFTFSMPARDLTYTAKFSTNIYALTITSNDENKGTVYESGSGSYAFNSEVTVTALEEEGHEFIGWYTNDVLVSTADIYIFLMPHKDLSLTAKFVTKYEVYVDDWSPEQDWGVIYGAGAYGYGTTVTLTAVPNDGYYFDVWYDEFANELTNDATYTFIMPEHDVTLGAVFTDVVPLEVGKTHYTGLYPQTKVTDQTLITTLNGDSGTLPTNANSAQWTSYNYYISSSNTTNFMWFQDVSVGEELYRGVYFTSYRPYYTTYSSSTSNSYQDENGYNLSTRYWFKYEPIAWDVLSLNEEAGPLLLASKLLDSQEYYHSTSNRTIGGQTVYANNYKESNVRAWLNNNFLNTAFSGGEQTKIKTSNVDNSVYSTGYTTNQYATDNTNDKIFLLSYREVTNADYGFSTNTSRVRSATDYAKAMGIYVYSSTGKSYWWLRSPHDYFSDDARSVYYGGVINSNSVYGTGSGIVPAFRINQ